MTKTTYYRLPCRKCSAHMNIGTGIHLFILFSLSFMSWATTITISRILIVRNVREKVGYDLESDKPSTHLYIEKHSNEIINKTTEKCGNVERKMISQFFHHHLSVPHRHGKSPKRKVSEGNNLEATKVGDDRSWVWNKTHINMVFQKCVDENEGRNCFERRWREKEKDENNIEKKT